MAGAGAGRVLSLTFVFVFFGLSSAQGGFSVPDVKFEVLQPRGFRVSIPDVSQMSLFVFQGNVNRRINSNSVGSLKGEVLQPTNGRWVFEDRSTELKTGDVINYYVFVSVNRVGYLKDNLSYTVTAFEDRGEGTTSTTRATSSSTQSSVKCLPTITAVRGGRACGGQIIFEDSFSSLREDVWQVEQYLPVTSHPEYPFVSYQKLQTGPVVFVSGGNLHIKPKIQQLMPGFTNDSIYLGSLDLFSGCTSRAEECYRQASGPDILPPVASGRLTTSSFAFLYGTVTIKAKLPQGDWLYPEMLLEPFLKKYGNSNYASGVLKIASARGNRDLRASLNEYGNKVLYGGPIMDAQCREQLIATKVMADGTQWGDQFHDYSVTWTPQYISLSVDGQQWARVDAGNGLRTRFSHDCSHLPRALLEKGTKMAPFDDYFYITLGVAAGGITEFLDDSYSAGGRPKPWRNSGRKGMLNFWEDLAAWETTWSQPELLIDHITVVAL